MTSISILINSVIHSRTDATLQTQLFFNLNLCVVFFFNSPGMFFLEDNGMFLVVGVGRSASPKLGLRRKSNKAWYVSSDFISVCTNKSYN